MRKSFRIGLLGFIGLTGLAVIAPTGSRALAQGDMKPVDQAVGDLDLLSASLRQREVGLRLQGQESGLYEVPADQLEPGDSTTGRQFYVVGQGFQAIVPRIDYVVRRGKKDLDINMPPQTDGEFQSIVPPDAVFLLTPPQIRSSDLSDVLMAPPNPARLDFDSLKPIDPAADAMILGSRIPDRIRLHDRAHGRLPGWTMISRSTTRAPRAPGQMHSATRRSVGLGGQDARIDMVSPQPIDYRLDYRVDLTTGEGFAHQTVAPVDLRPLLRQRALERQLLEQQKAQARADAYKSQSDTNADDNAAASTDESREDASGDR